MDFRDKLARLSAPVRRATAVSAAVDEFARTGASGVERETLEREIAVELEPRLERDFDGSERAFEEPTRVLAAIEPRARANVAGEPESESDRAERISQLRSLIGNVLARGAAWREPRPAADGSSDASEVEAARRPRARDASNRVQSLDGPKSAGSRGALLAAIAGAERAAAQAFAEAAVAAHDGAGRDTTSYSLRTRAHRVPAPLDAGEAGADAVESSMASRVHMLREAIDGWAPARGRLARVFARQPWATRETPFGPLHVVERWLEPAHRHGTIAVHSALERLPATVAALALDPELAQLDFSRMLFLDTETTGLMGGSGTVAFLVGIASFHDDSLLLTQLLLPNLGGEVPMLLALAEHLAAASCILTYNGKSFDWPLLRTRYVMNRLPVPALPPHVDLLHASRRIWKPRLGSVRLTDVEREIMRFSREGDVDGAEIPSRYFSFLRDGGTEWLVPVLEHNQNDLIALPAMLGVLGERFEHIECGEHALDALAYGRLALRVADGARAAAFAVAAVTASEGSPLESHAWSFRGEVARRAREAEVAVQHYEQALELCDEELRSATLHVLLSKLYEHGLRDLRAAYRHARRTEPAEGPELHGRRLGRLTRKIERAAEREAAPKSRRALVQKRSARARTASHASGESR